MLRPRAWQGWLALAILLLFLRPPARSFLYVNEAVYATVAQQMTLGARMWADAAEWKGPLLFLLFYAVLKPTGCSVVALHLFGLLVALGLVACVAALARLTSGRQAAGWAAAFCVVFMAHTVGPSVEADLLTAAFGAGAYLCFLAYVTGPQASAALGIAPGLLLVAGLSCKQTGVLDLAALVAACLALLLIPAHRPRVLRALGLLALGVAVGAGLVAAAVAHFASFHDYLAWSWLMPLSGQATSLQGRIGLVLDLHRDVVQPTALLWGLALVGCLVVVRTGGMGAEPGGPPASPTPAGLVLPLWLAATTLAGEMGSHSLAYHLVVAAAPLSVLAAAGLACLLDARGDGSARRGIAAAVAATLFLSLLSPMGNSLWRWRDRVLADAPKTTDRLAGERAAALTTPGDRIVVLDHNPAPLFWSGRLAGSRYMSVDFVWEPAYLRAAQGRLARLLGPVDSPRDLFLSDVRRTRPRVLILPVRGGSWSADMALPGARELVDTLLIDFRFAESVGEYDLFTRRDAMSPRPAR